MLLRTANLDAILHSQMDFLIYRNAAHLCIFKKKKKYFSTDVIWCTNNALHYLTVSQTFISVLAASSCVVVERSMLVNGSCSTCTYDMSYIIVIVDE